MIAYKCKNCGGQMNFDGSVGLTCPFCGSKSFFSDDDFKGNEKFRKMLLQYYKAEAEKKDVDYSTDCLWSYTGRDSYTMKNGQMLNIEYMKKYDRDGLSVYLARESVVYVFDAEAEAISFLNKLKRLVFPSADIKLHRSFPELKMEIGLLENRHALVFKRRPNCYPAEFFAPWESVHIAWVISRMENICCALEYSELEHGDISADSVWINPFTHEGILFGDWRRVKTLSSNADLKALRKTAILLAENTKEPEEMYRFLNSEPAKDAYSDFEKWDEVIEKGFGGHNFRKMDV
ncbi:hypothetical protein UYO_1043 [Lachnospiraceae bacterium JC7]|nr:hypothetical protein UYO_1043 [Lachnospiraceae bacterium JC7]